MPILLLNSLFRNVWILEVPGFVLLLLPEKLLEHLYTVGLFFKLLTTVKFKTIRGSVATIIALLF